MKTGKKVKPKLAKAKEILLAGESELFLALDQLRRGYAEQEVVRRRLLDGLTPLVKAERPTLWGALWIGLATAVDRLLRNGRADLLPFIVDELERTERDYWQEESPHVYPPPSTNSTRKRLGKEPHPKVRRHTGSIDGSGLLSYGKRRIGRKGRVTTSWFRVRPPIRLPVHEADKWHPREVVVSGDERRVLEWLLLGFSQRETVERTGLTLYRVRQIVAALRQRMQRYEAQDPRHSRNGKRGNEHSGGRSNGGGHSEHSGDRQQRRGNRPSYGQGDTD